jgi:hypothetical protein
MTNASEVLAELVALKDLKEEILRRKQRRAVWLKRDAEAVDEVRTMEEDYKHRQPMAWAAARAVLQRDNDQARAA